MKYIISRTSEKEPPHPNAEKVQINHYRDVRTFRNKEEWLEMFPEDAEDAIEWGQTIHGSPYRIISSIHTIYTIEISNLNEFVKKAGEIILGPPKLGLVGFEDLMHIEIYDDYRE